MTFKKAFAFFTSIFICLSAFAEFSVISPVSGTWANKQVLLLSIPEQDSAYYSVNGTDPMVSGFAYDGPVTIDVTGVVEIRIATVSPEGKITEKSVEYRIEEKVPETDDEKKFLRTLTSLPVYEYLPGDSLEIPSSFYYSVGDGNPVYIPAKTLSLAKDCSVMRYIPLVLTDGSSFWRNIIYIKSAPGLFNQRQVPFTVENWTKITFTNKSNIYCIDDGWWIPATKPIDIDRSMPHTIKWQSASYQSTNPIQSFVLPAKPYLKKTVRPDGSVDFSVSESSSYKLSASGESKRNFAQGIFSKLCVDTFLGDTVNNNVTFSVFADNVYQGELSSSYEIDRRPPNTPILQSSTTDFFARDNVNVKIISESDSQIYVAKSMPIEIDDDFNTAIDYDDLKLSSLGKYEKLNGNEINIISNSEKAVYNKISVYSEDSAGNRSNAVEYDVIIDGVNFYFDESADETVANGTREKPYKSLEQFATSGIKNPYFAHFHVRGNLNMPDGLVSLPSNCRITGTNDALISFSKNSFIDLRIASLEINNCVIHKGMNQEYSKETNCWINMENSILLLNGCEIITQFDNSGSVIQANASVITIKNSGIVNQSTVYATIISSVATRVIVTNSRISSIAQTAVNFSLHEGFLDLKSSACKVVGTIGRVAELLGTQCSFISNSFTGELLSTQSLEAIWKDSDVITMEDSNNIIKGF